MFLFDHINSSRTSFPVRKFFPSIENMLSAAINSCKLKGMIQLSNAFAHPLCFSKCILLYFSYYFDVVARHPRQLTANIRLWRFRHELTNLPRWNHFVMFPSRTKARTKIERSVRWSSRKSDEARDWQRKCVKRVPRFGSHSCERLDTERDVSFGIDVSRSSKIFHFARWPLLSGSLGRRRRFESRLVSTVVHARSFYLTRYIFWKIWQGGRTFLSIPFNACRYILMYITDFSNRRSNFTNFIEPRRIISIKEILKFELRLLNENSFYRKNR